MPQWTKALYLAYLKSAHWKAVQKAIYRTNPLCFIHRRRCRRPNIHHLSYDNLYHESLLLDGKHDLVVLCKPVHLDFLRGRSGTRCCRMRDGWCCINEIWNYKPMPKKDQCKLHKMINCIMCHYKPKKRADKKHPQKTPR